MKDWMVIVGTLILGGILGYVIFLITSSNSSSNGTLGGSETLWNNGFQPKTTQFPSSDSSDGSSSFKIQSRTDKPSLVK